MYSGPMTCYSGQVALLAEGVDRNLPVSVLPPMRESRPPRGGVDKIHKMVKSKTSWTVALLAEGVDKIPP